MADVTLYVYFPLISTKVRPNARVKHAITDESRKTYVLMIDRSFNIFAETVGSIPGGGGDGVIGTILEPFGSFSLDRVTYFVNRTKRLDHFHGSTSDSVHRSLGFEPKTGTASPCQSRPQEKVDQLISTLLPEVLDA